MKNMFTSMKFQLAAVSMLLLASCAQTIDPRYAITKDEIETMKSKQFRHTADGAMQGAVVGAALGAGTAALTGGDVKKAAIGGGIAGAIGGGALGFNQGDKKGKELVQQKRNTKAIQSEIAERTKDARNKNKQAQQMLAKLRAGVTSGNLTESQLSQEKRKATNAIDEAINNLQLTDELKGGPGAAGLNAQISELKRSRAQIEQLGSQAGKVKKA